jgi:hypothetical protein
MPHKNKEVKAAYNKDWYEANKERTLAQKKAWYKANREKILAMRKLTPQERKKNAVARAKANAARAKVNRAAYIKVYLKDNREKVSATRKAWYEANKERVSAYIDKEKRAAYQKAYQKVWRENNRDKDNAKQSRRRAHKLSLIPKHLKNCPIEKQRMVNIYKLRRLISKATGIVHHVDHMWPLSAGGPEWSGNLQIITAHENISKRDKVDPELKRNIKQSLKELENDLHI